MKSLLKRLYHAIPRPPSTNYLFHIPQNPYRLLNEGAVIFDVGSKDARGSYAFGTPPERSKIVCVDIEPGEGVDLVADIHDMHMVPDDSIDCVITVSTLEHVRYPQKAMQEILRMMKPGGVLYVSVPFIFPFHSDPYDNYRFSSDGVRILCEDFECVESGFNRGPASTMCHLIVHFSAILFSFNNRTVYGINVDLFTWLFFWIKYLDVFLGKYKMAKVIHAGAYFLGRKPATSTTL